tara:strand:+ start:107 stop:541 length:435 start_codon:yes stop_codon:yes gene_type:complete
MSNNEIDELIINLAILSKLEINKKLSTKESYLNIENNNGTLQSILEGPKRWWYGECRDTAIKKIDLLISKSLRNCKDHPILVDYLQNSIKGLENLKNTYLDCTQTNARLDVIIDKINRNLNNKNNKNNNNKTNENTTDNDVETY